MLNLGAGVGTADDSTAKLVARVLVAAGEAEAEALALAVDDELAARSAELAALAEYQRSLCVAAAAAPEARLQLMAGWSSFAESAEYVTFEAELTRRLVVEGHNEDEARAAVCTTLATASLDASVHGSVRSGYTLVQGLAAAALQGQEGALLAWHFASAPRASALVAGLIDRGQTCVAHHRSHARRLTCV